MNKLENFLNQHEAATKHSYGISLKQFFEWKQVDPDDYIKDLKKMNAEQKEETLKNYQNDIKNYWQYIKQTWKPKYSRNAKLNAVRQYLIEYEIEFPTIFWKRLKKGKDKGARAATIDRAPTRHELRRIIHEGKPIARAIAHIAASTGMRLGEILQLKKEDIDMHKDPIWINIKGETTKIGDPRTVYLSDEATIALKRWLTDKFKDKDGNEFTERDKWFETIQSRMKKLSMTKGFETLKDKHKNDDGTIFPITRQTAESYWQTMLKRANLDMRDPTTNMRVLHFHTLRKWFRSAMIKPLGIDITEAIMGHRGYLTEAYRRYSKDDLAKMYKQNMKHVTIIQEPIDVDKLEKDIDTKMQEKDKQIENMQRETEVLENKLEMMETRMQLMEMKLDQEKIKNHIKSH